MKDAMQIARQRRQEHIDEIARLENEIENLQDRIGELETFLEFGETLIDGNTADSMSASDETDDFDVEDKLDAPTAVTRPGPRSIMPVDAWHAEDEDDAADQSIARVLSARNG